MGAAMVLSQTGHSLLKLLLRTERMNLIRVGRPVDGSENQIGQLK